MKKLSGGAKESASLGHKLEKPVIQSLLNEQPQYLATYAVGMVEFKCKPYFKDSLEFVVVTK